MRKRLPNGLTAKEDQFCVFLCQGYSQRESYKRAGLAKRLSDDSIDQRASKLAKRDHARARCAALLEAAGVKDLDAIGRAISDTLRVMGKAEAEGNYTAFAALNRQRLQYLGLLKDSLAVTVENSAGDSDLIARLAGGDPAKQAALEAIVGRSGFAH